jgi:hypothetical protein
MIWICVAASALVAMEAHAQEETPPAAPPEPPPPAPAPKPAPATKEFGSAGTVDFGAVTAFGHAPGIIGIPSVAPIYSTVGVDHTTKSPPQGDSDNSTVILIAPEVDYFVIDDLSIGGAVLLGIVIPKTGDTATLIGIGPTVGYNIWLSRPSLSLWPRASFVYESLGGNITGTSTTGGTTTTTSQSFTYSKGSIGFYVPLMIHPVQHFHFGIGPYFALDVLSNVKVGSTSSDGDKSTVIGLRAEIGGWL